MIDIEWRRLPPPLHLYEVSNLGAVRSFVRGAAKVLKQDVNRQGYSTVRLTVDGKTKRFRVHLLVLASFHGDRPSGLQACHNNGVRTDNRAVNLRWDTVSNNAKDRILHGTQPRGEQHWKSKLTNEDVSSIRERLAAGQRGTDIAAYFEVSKSAVSLIKRGITWKLEGQFDD